MTLQSQFEYSVFDIVSVPLRLFNFILSASAAQHFFLVFFDWELHFYLCCVPPFAIVTSLLFFRHSHFGTKGGYMIPSETLI